AGADRPHRLVSHRDRRQLFLESGQAAADLSLDDLEGPSRLTLRERLAHADDGRHSVRQGHAELLPHALIGLAEKLAPLAVPDDDVLAPDLGEHARRDLPG